MKLQLFISLLQRDKKKFVARNKFSNQTNPLPIIPIAKKKKRDLQITSKTETENKKEDRYLPLIIPAGIIGNRFCNFDKLFAGNRGMGKVRSISKFPAKRESLSIDITAHTFPTTLFELRGEGGRKEGKRKKETRAAFELRSKTSPQPSPSSVFIQLLWAGQRRFVCARHTKFQPGELTHKHFYPRFSEL